MLKTLSCWVKRKPLPSNANGICISIGRNEDNFIVIVKGGTGIYKYNDINDEWIKITPIPNKYQTGIHEAALDTKSKKLYVFTSSNMELLQTTLNTNDESCIWHCFNIFGKSFFFSAFSRAIIIEDELHLLGGSATDKHVKWDTKSKSFIQVTTLPHKIYGFELVDDTYNNRILLFGGYVSDVGHSDGIFEYNINKKIWRKLEIKMPASLCVFGCTKAIYDKYVLIFGGNDNIRYHDKIYVYSLMDDTFKESKIKCPKEGRYEAISVKNEYKDKLVVAGYIRKEWRILNINNSGYCPMDLQMSINMYYYTEYVHLFAKDTDSQHWKMSALNIVET